MSKVLIIDDEENLRKLIARVISLEGYTVHQAATIKEGLRLLERESVDVVISDVKLPDGNGIELTSLLKKQYPAVEVIVLTAYGTIQDGVTAIKNGAFDYLTKGDHQERILPLLSKASEKALLQQKVFQLEARLQERFGFGHILGHSNRIQDSIVLARKVAPTDTTVLLLGETGTGKEIFAQAIHYESNRKTKPFVAVNCSAFPKDLLESELFGHAEGAFTGATKAKKGYLDEAQDGSLFLDEIGEMPVDLQAKLLRVLETGEFYRVGESRARRVNVRFIAATNRNPEKESQAGNFRQDLFYRLSVFTIPLPPLRERSDDIPLLAEYFVRQFSQKTKKSAASMSPTFLQALRAHPWKGNIRELKNVIERCVILNDLDVLEADMLPYDFNTYDPATGSDEAVWALAAAEKKHIRQVLAFARGNKTQAAKLLGIGLTTLYQKIKDYALQSDTPDGKS